MDPNSGADGNGQKRLVEGIAFTYLARVGIPLMLSALGFMVMSQWNDQKTRLDTLGSQITILGERIMNVTGKLDTEIQLRIQNDDQIRDRVREIERRERRSDLPQLPHKVE